MESRIENAELSVGCPPPSSSARGEEWKTFQFHIHDFANLSDTEQNYVLSPNFISKGHKWALRIHPGGFGEATEGIVSAYLIHRSEGRISTRYQIKIIDKFGKAKAILFEGKAKFSGETSTSLGWCDFISRSAILDESNNILDSNGTLAVVVSIEEEPTTVFVPKNPLVQMMQQMFNDEATADVCFEVSAAKETKDDDGAKMVKATTPFYAHRTILQGCAPMLADMCGSSEGGGVVTASINDVNQDVFRHLLFYVYGGSIPEQELKAHAKDIINAANKYSIINLKLEAEAFYVQSTEITLDNAVDNLLYADSKNCALLKETVMNFLAENNYDAAENISFTDFPGHCAKDLLISVARNSKKDDANETNADELTTLDVSAFRRKLDSMGLEVDGSREAMIESIKNNS